jgi:poly-gamma-glutamate synthesis protein (capsule biosynthesis protein)
MEKHGPAYVTRDVEPWLRGADFVHISHEVSLFPDCDPEKTFKGALCGRESYIEALEASHAKIIELTGSHLADYGRRWIDHTLDLYAARGWVWFGGGRNQFEASEPRIVEHNGNRVAFLGCNMPQTTAQFIVEGPGVAACDVERLRADVADLRRRGIVPIVSIQHEEVYEHEPPGLVVRDFRRIAEAGAAVVFGSQAHSAHPWDVHFGAFVHYGAGNFLFDQQFKVTRDGAHDKLYIYDGKLLSVGQLFTRIEEWGKPRPMTPDERVLFLAKLQVARKSLPPAKPWDAPRAPDPRRRMDSFLVGKQLQRVVVTAPTKVTADQRYPLVVDLIGDTVDERAFVAHVSSKSRRVAAAAQTYLRAKYPIDPEKVTLRGKTSRR